MRMMSASGQQRTSMKAAVVRWKSVTARSFLTVRHGCHSSQRRCHDLCARRPTPARQQAVRKRLLLFLATHFSFPPSFLAFPSFMCVCSEPALANHRSTNTNSKRNALLFPQDRTRRSTRALDHPAAAATLQAPRRRPSTALRARAQHGLHIAGTVSLTSLVCSKRSTARRSATLSRTA